MNQKSGKKQKTASTGKAYTFVSAIFVTLFIGMIAYMIYFQLVKSEDILSSPYNSRQEIYSDTIIRGAVLASSGVNLAYTETDENGNEYRVYPYGRLFAQTVGYSDYGAAGLEATQNSILLQSNSDLVSQVKNDLANEKNYGDNLVTSFNIDLQQAAYDALGGRKGAVVVLDADTSKVLACVSQPDFDPNTVSEDWETLNTDDSGSPFLNRALQGVYEPGSTFKIVTALAFIKDHPDDFTDFTFECTGEYTQGSYTIHCNNNTAHGTQTLYDAFANSCNCAFSYIATNLLDTDTLSETADELKFNTEFKLELSTSLSYFGLEKTIQDGLTMQTAIGQGDTSVTPLHMAMIAQAVYNNGIMLKPSFIYGVSTSEGKTVSEKSVSSLGSVMSSFEASALKELMSCVVERGTASSLSDLSLGICGKTGTAEYNNQEGYSHSWFVGFSNTGIDDIVISVIVEEAGSGEAPAVDVARSVFLAYYS